MNDKEAIEKVKLDYVSRSSDIKSIHTECVSETTLNNMLSICDNTKHMEELINWYDDEEDFDRSNWQDIEGEGYGWLWLKEENDETKWHGLLRDSLLQYIKDKKQKITDKDEFFVIVTTDNKVIYHFIERESSMCDTIYTFSNEELDF